MRVAASGATLLRENDPLVVIHVSRDGRTLTWGRERNSLRHRLACGWRRSSWSAWLASLAPRGTNASRIDIVLTLIFALASSETKHSSVKYSLCKCGLSLLALDAMLELLSSKMKCDKL